MKRVKKIQFKYEINDEKPYLLVLNNSGFFGTGKQIRKKLKRYKTGQVYELPVES